MNWYYVEGGQQAGPVPDTELDGLVRAGRIKADTLVWHEGMANWRPFWEARPESGLRLTEPTGATPQTTAAPTGADVVCAQCNGVFARDNAIQYGNVWVCANCKPIFVQKLKEGAVLPGMGAALNYGGFWIRFAAKLIVGLILGVVLGIPFLILIFRSVSAPSGPGQPPAFAIGFQVLLQFVYYGLSVGYNVFFLGRYGATPGKMACGLRVVTADGAKISYARALGRSLAEIISGITCYIGYIIAAFDAEKRTLHDHICNTRVIKIR